MINKELEQLTKTLQKEILDQLDMRNKEREEMLNNLFFLADWILSNASDRIRVHKKQYLEIVDKYKFEQYMPSKNTLILLRKELLREADK